VAAERIDEHFHGERTYPRAHCWPGCRKWSMPCPACHHPEHDPGACPECPRCELHIDETLIWLSRVSREDYDEFIEGVERDAIKGLIENLIVALSRAFRGRGLAVWEIEEAIRDALNEVQHE
jgi:hypothetical protein